MRVWFFFKLKSLDKIDFQAHSKELDTLEGKGQESKILKASSLIHECLLGK